MSKEICYLIGAYGGLLTSVTYCYNSRKTNLIFDYMIVGALGGTALAHTATKLVPEYSMFITLGTIGLSTLYRIMTD